ncbi:Clr5 domain-containing protein [Xylariales sp. PMI_506]|nr:Clr5 domain-containing protein [Xylariales sp. PMI_506]
MDTAGKTLSGTRSAVLRPLAPRPGEPGTAATKGLSAKHAPARHKRAAWLEMYPHIQRLYVHQGRKLRDVMMLMERDHNFVASKPMYKKRLMKWGFMKNSSQHTPDTDEDIAKSTATSWCHPGSAPGSSVASCMIVPLSHVDSGDLHFVSKVRDWTLSYFQSGMAPTPCLRWSESVHYAIKLAADLLSRGQGTLAGRMVRKSFLLLEDSLRLDGPALIWNMTELIFLVAQKGNQFLLRLLLNHILNLARHHHHLQHPLVQIITYLQREASSSEHQKIMFILIQAAAINASLILDHLNDRYISLYQRLLWDNCTLRLPDSVAHRGHESFLAFQPSNERTEPQEQPQTVSERFVCNDRSVRDLCQLDLDDPRLSTRALSVRLRAAFAPTRSEEPHGALMEHMQIAASITMTAAEIDFKDGRYIKAEKNAVQCIGLRENSSDTGDLRVVWALWLMEDILVQLGRFKAAANFRRQASEKISLYLQDIPVNAV